MSVEISLKMDSRPTCWISRNRASCMLQLIIICLYWFDGSWSSAHGSRLLGYDQCAHPVWLFGSKGFSSSQTVLMDACLKINNKLGQNCAKEKDRRIWTVKTKPSVERQTRRNGEVEPKQKGKVLDETRFGEHIVREVVMCKDEVRN